MTLKQLRCPDCKSLDVVIKHMDDDDPRAEGELECEDCGNIEVVNRVPLKEVFSDVE